LPSTLIGGVAAVAVTGATLTLGAMVGFVALFGMAARNLLPLKIVHGDGNLRLGRLSPTYGRGSHANRSISSATNS